MYLLDGHIELGWCCLVGFALANDEVIPIGLRHEDILVRNRAYLSSVTHVLFNCAQRVYCRHTESYAFQHYIHFYIKKLAVTTNPCFTKALGELRRPQVQTVGRVFVKSKTQLLRKSKD